MEKKTTCRAYGRLLRQNLGRVLGFELLYTAVTACLGLAGTLWLWRLLGAVSGYSLLSSAQTWAYLARPPVLVLLLLLAVGACFAGLAEALALVWCFEEGCHGRRAGLREMLAAGVQGVLRCLRRKNWPLVVLAALLLPFTRLAALGCLLVGVHLPGYLEAFLRAWWPLCLLGLAAVLGLLWLLLRYSLAFHCFSLEGKDAKEALAQSARLMKDRPLKTRLVFLLWQGVLLVAALALAAGLSALAVLAVRLALPGRLAYEAALRAVYGLWLAVGWLTLRLSAPFSFARLAGLYHTRRADGAGACPRPVALRPLLGRVLPLACLWALAAGGLAFWAEQNRAVSLAAHLAEKPAVMAHRGDSIEAPENTLPAFQKAIDKGVEWIELDVHQTKDGRLVVLHDDNLKRLAGLDKNVWEMTYAELARCDVGAWFSPAYAGTHPPTLEEVLQLCKGKIKLNIELKVTGHETDFEKQVLETVLAGGFEKDCVLASLNAGALKKLKELGASIPTVYILPGVPGGMETLPFADVLSLQASATSWQLVNSAHGAGKRVYAWTVNREYGMEEMLDLRVDGLITNDPVRARELLAAAHLSGPLAQVVGSCFQGAASPARGAG